MDLKLYRTKVQANPYHLVQPSPWPLLTSFSLLALTFSLVLYFHGYFNFHFVLIPLISVVSVILLWFRDITAEGTYLGDHTFAVQNGLTIGFALFLVSEIIVFFSIFWAFFHSALAPNIELGVHWPPIGINPISPFEVPLLNTILLLSSGASATYAHHSLIGKNRKEAVWGMVLTLVLAVIFTSLQAYEYWTAPFTISDSIYGTVFYASTGTHAVHVLIGTLFLIVSLARIVYYHLTNHHHLGFESALLYWHIVDVVWLFLYVSVYWWGA